MTKWEKMVEYFTKTWYSIFRIEREEVNNMQDMVMKGIYEKSSSITKKNPKKRWKLFEILHYSYLLSKKAKQIDYSKYLTQNEDICNGEAVIKNTRIRPITVFNYFISLKLTDMDEVMKKIKENYPALDDETIVVSFLYCIKTYNLKKLFW